jgi:CheY-like chemotaxis protein
VRLASLMKRKRILLVDDYVDHLELLAVILGEQYDARACASAEEAHRVVEEFRPDLLVLDVRMHPIDGVQCLEAIRAMPGYDNIPAIALTALARDVEKAALLKAGFQDILTKPILDQASFMIAIDGVLEASLPSQSQLSLHGESFAA